MRGAVAVVIPAYNEEHDLERNVKKLHKFLGKELRLPWKIIVAENGSTDNTLAIAKKLEKELPHVHAIKSEEKGKGAAIKKAWEQSNATILSYMDADLSTSLQHFPPILEAVQQGNQLAIASRFLPGSRAERSLFREILSRAYIGLARLILSSRITDFQCGCKAIDAGFARKIVPLTLSSGFFFDTEMCAIAERLGAKIKQQAVQWRDFEESKVRIGSTIVTYVISLIKLRLRLRELNAREKI